MSAPTSTDGAVRRSVEVRVPVEVAWRVFTAEMGSWWPLASHSLSAEGGVTPDDVVVEGRVGGAIYEAIGDDRLGWGTVAEWAPPTRLAVDWTVSGDVVTRWTATFTATDAGTRVDLVHDGFGDGTRGDELRASYGDEQGWTFVLARFAESTSG
jgi:hypothetical protein